MEDNSKKTKNSGDGAKNNLNLVGRKHSVKMDSQDNVIQNKSTTAASSKMMAQLRGNSDSVSVPEKNKEVQEALRGRVFDDMYHTSHFGFGYQRVDPTIVRSNTSLHLGRCEMWFGDLDFSADAAALLGHGDATRSFPLPIPVNDAESESPVKRPR